MSSNRQYQKSVTKKQLPKYKGDHCIYIQNPPLFRLFWITNLDFKAILISKHCITNHSIINPLYYQSAVFQIIVLPIQCITNPLYYKSTIDFKAALKSV